jgi:hypothetical protein
MARTITQSSTGSGTAVAVLIAIAVAILASLGAATSAQAQFSITSFDDVATKQDGTTVETGAGAHPYALTTSIDFPTVTDGSGNVRPAENVKDLRVDLPVGFVGDPSVTPRCRDEQLDAYRCSVASQVGVVVVRQGVGSSNVGTLTAPLYNMVPSAGSPAEFGFTTGLFPIHARVSVRTGADYGLTFQLHDIPQPTAVLGTTITLWGVPADPGHDADRGQTCLEFPPFPRFCQSSLGGGPGPSAELPLPFLTNPADCSAGPLTSEASAASWQHPGDVVTATSRSHLSDGTPAGVDSCDRLRFGASLAARPVERAAGTPSSYVIDLSVPQNDNPTGRATPPLKKVVVRLPSGAAVSTASADGLAACAPAQIALDRPTPATCPDASKIGTVEIETPVLPEPLTGAIFLARQADNPFGTLLAAYIAVEGAGVVLKLPGRIDADPATGQLTATFDTTPQLPFSHLHLELKGGTRAPVTIPKACGTYTTHAELTSWASAAPVSSDSTFTVDQGCGPAGKFEPTMSAGVTDLPAGGSPSFVLDVGRPDGQQDLSTLDVALPPGVLAHVGQVPLCGEAEAAAGSCSPASQVGRATIAAGPGASPLSIPQAGRAATAVHLAGPYKGAPYSLVIVVPAQAGPFDLGVVVVRAALFVDPVDAHVTVRSDPLPTILQGIPLDVRRIGVTIDRPGFMVSPTSCDPLSVTGQVTSAQGLTATVQNRFQAADCAALGFRPKLVLRLSGRGQTRDGRHPGLLASLTMPSGQANLAQARVALPLSLALDPDNAQSGTLCEYDAGRQTIPDCPKSSVVGTATARTPLLDQPLTGPVFFVKNVRIDPKTGRQVRTLPTLAIPLRGGGLTLVLRASSAVVDGHLVTTFDHLPDAPVSSFALDLEGGSKGILVVSGADLCKATQNADQVIRGQNGKAAVARIAMGTPCPLAVVASGHTATSLKVTAGGIGAGRVSVSGSMIARTSRTIASATTATLQPMLTRAARSRLAAGRNVRTRIRLSFTPKGGGRAKVAHKTLTIHGAVGAARRR